MDYLSRLPYVPSRILWEMLDKRDLVALASTNRVLYCNVEHFLYRRHAVTLQNSAVMWAIETVNPDTPETLTRALTILDKVKKFCHLAPGVLDYAYSLRRNYIDIDPPRQFPNLHGRRYSLTALHLAAWKGLDAIVDWLLQGGANVNCESSAVTPLYLAVLNDKASSALLLLSYGASPAMQRISSGPVSVLHLACAMGYTNLVEQLLATKSVPADTTDVLRFIQRDVPAVVELLARDADFPDDLISEFIKTSIWQSASALIQAKKRRGGISRTKATTLLELVCSRFSYGAPKVQNAHLVVRQLLDSRADPKAGRQLLASSTLVFPTLLELLPPLLEAGMRATGKDDSLGMASAYDRNQDEEGASAQLQVVRLLLQHGARIGPATRGDALDSLTPRGDQGRCKWAYQLCSALVEHCREHCRQIPRHRRAKDITAFLARLSNTNKRLGDEAFDIDFI